MIKITSVLHTSEDQISRDQIPYTVNGVISPCYCCPPQNLEFEETVTSIDRGEPGYRVEGFKVTSTRNPMNPVMD